MVLLGLRYTMRSSPSFNSPYVIPIRYKVQELATRRPVFLVYVRTKTKQPHRIPYPTI